MSYEPQFEVGKTYRTRGGRVVKIIAESMTYGPRYRCVQGDDGQDRVHRCWRGLTGPNEVYEITPGTDLGWRYDREGDVGRCTGSDPGGDGDLLPGAIPSPAPAGDSTNTGESNG